MYPVVLAFGYSSLFLSSPDRLIGSPSPQKRVPNGKARVGWKWEVGHWDVMTPLNLRSLSRQGVPDGSFQELTQQAQTTRSLQTLIILASSRKGDCYARDVQIGSDTSQDATSTLVYTGGLGKEV